MIRSKSEKIFGGLCVTVTVIFALMCLYPLIYTLGLSLMPQNEWDHGGRLMLLFPKAPTLAAYGKALGAADYVLRAFGVSLFRTIVGTLLSLIFTSLAGYVLSRPGLPGKKYYMYLVLTTILFSGGLIPTYIVVSSLNLTNTIWSMIIPGIVNTWNVLIFKQFFEAIPKDIEEAAKCDGVNELQMLMSIILPMSKAVFAAIGLFTVVGHWNSWFDARIYISQEYFHLWPLQLFVQVNFENASQMNQSNLEFLIQGQGVTALATKMALTVLTLLPILITYPFFQKYFQKGVYMGAVKG